MTVIRIPTPLRPYTEGLKEVEVEGKTVGTVIHAVADQYPGIQPHIFDDEGNLRAYVNIFLNEFADGVFYFVEVWSPLAY